MKKLIFFIFLIAINYSVLGQVEIYTQDIDNFWTAYDSIQKTADRNKQTNFIKKLYLDKSSEGLKSFIIKKETLAEDYYLNNIIAYPNFWNSIRPRTLEVKSYIKPIEKIMCRFRRLYPEFKEPKIYFTIGLLNSGGTTTKKEIFIGTEISSANKDTNATELGKWLQDVFKSQTNILSIIAHELVHTQQRNGDSENDGNSNLLGYCIAEGSCDFIAELLLKKTIKGPYMVYGKTHEKELWDLFKKEMYGQEIKNWLYNGNNAPNGNADLGYYVGYEICKSYYRNSENKELALKEIIELDYTKENVLNFLKKSKYQEKNKR